MKTIRILSVVTGLIGAAAIAGAQGFAPTTNIADTYFTGVLTGSAGGANADGTFTDFFAASDLDYSIGTNNVLSDPVAYSFANTGANTAIITEGSLTVALTYTSATAGTFLATYSAGVTQTGTFTTNTTPAEVPLTALSCRTTIAANGDAIGGFYIGGSVAHTVLIRAVGPGLAPFNVTGTLAAPQFTLYQGGTAIGSGGTTTTALQAVYAATGAFNLPIGSPDSVLETTLSPGGYSAVVSGGSATDAGQVIIEIYFVN